MVAGQLELLMFANIARLTQDMNAVKGVVGGAMGHVERVVGVAKGALASLGAGLSVAVLLHKVDSVTESMAHLQDVSEKTGASVERLSQIKFFADVSGSNINDLSSALAKLSKGMSMTGSEAAPTTQALKFLGLSAKDAAGNLKDPSVLFEEISQALIQYEDGAGKAAIAQALFGKAGAEMLPTLKKMAELGAVEASVTTEQARAAEDYQVALARLHRQKEIVWNQIVGAMLPSMQALVEALLDASKKTDSLQGAAKELASDGSIEAWADKGAIAIASLIDAVKVLPKLFTLVTSEMTVLIGDVDVLAKRMTLANLPAAAAQVLTGKNPLADLKTSLDARNIAIAERDKVLHELLNSEVDSTQRAVRAQIDARKSLNSFMKGIGTDSMLDDAMFGGGEGLKKLNFSPVDAKLAAAELKLYQGAVKRLVDELGELNKQSEREKLNFELFGQNVKTADGAVVHLTGNLEKLTPQHKAMLQVIAAEIDRRKDVILVSKLNGEAYDALYKSQQQLLSIQTATFQADRDYLDDLQFQISLLGKTSMEQTKLNELRKIDLKLRQDLKSAADAAGDNMSQYDSAREALLRQAQDQRTAVLQGVNDRIQAERDWMTGANDAFNTYIDNARNAAQQSRDLFTNSFKAMEDALVEFARTGKLDFKKLADVIIEQIIRIQTRVLLSKILEPMQAGGGGWLSLLGRALGFGTGSGGGGGGSSGSPADIAVAQTTAARGYAFDTNGIQAFARGGLIGSPHHFAFADGGMMRHGIAGEAGPEAIFPLTRINGRLGIEASGSQGGPQIVVDQSGWTFGSDVNQATLRQWGQVIEQRTKAGIADSVRRGGSYKKMVRG